LKVAGVVTTQASGSRSIVKPQRVKAANVRFSHEAISWEEKGRESPEGGALIRQSSRSGPVGFGTPPRSCAQM
jgi:hypothetical protein